MVIVANMSKMQIEEAYDPNVKGRAGKYYQAMWTMQFEAETFKPVGCPMGRGISKESAALDLIARTNEESGSHIEYASMPIIRKE